MVKKETQNNNTLYLCESCGFGYEKEKTAKKCENYCKTHNACSLEIITKAIKTGH
ncbi:MAG TPA: hypothetical protein VFE88_04775 [Candidatus Nanoarchaeia archaeon]|nr:hypothetical protein [Candidatus Nanoarchaeia archaeon]